MKNFLKKLFVTGFFAGYFPFFPGTIGALVGVLIFLVFNPFPYVYYPSIIIIFFLGAKYSFWAEIYFGKKDPKQVVIDEIAGMLVTMSGFNVNINLSQFCFSDYKILILGFVMFRIFDIIKPYPIPKIENLKGGWGIMLDDIIAGIYANILLWIFKWLS